MSHLEILHSYFKT